MNGPFLFTPICKSLNHCEEMLHLSELMNILTWKMKLAEKMLPCHGLNMNIFYCIQWAKILSNCLMKWSINSKRCLCQFSKVALIDSKVCKQTFFFSFATSGLVKSSGKANEHIAMFLIAQSCVKLISSLWFVIFAWAEAVKTF